MSEKTPAERVETQADLSGQPSDNRDQNSWIALLDAWARRAEAAERFADAAARCPVWGAVDAEHEKELRESVTAYRDAREAVRKLEETT